MRPLNYIFRSAKGHHPRGYCTVLLPKKGYYTIKSLRFSSSTKVVLRTELGDSKLNP